MDGCGAHWRLHGEGDGDCTKVDSTTGTDKDATSIEGEGTPFPSLSWLGQDISCLAIGWECQMEKLKAVANAGALNCD